MGHDAHFGIATVTAPTEQPITLTEAKAHLSIQTSFTSDDTLLNDYIAAATLFCERITRRQFVSATYDIWFDSFPLKGDRAIRLPRPPLQSITTVKYTDTDGVQQTLATSEYQVDSDSAPGRIVEAYSKTWPSIRDELQAVEIRFIAGYGAASAVPDDLKHAVKATVAHWYELRRPVSNLAVNDVPFSLNAILLAKKVWMF